MICGLTDLSGFPQEYGQNYHPTSNYGAPQERYTRPSLADFIYPKYDEGL